MDLTWPIPMPPVPMTARVRTSLGGVKPAPPRTCRGTMVRVVSEAMEVFRKRRRLTRWRLFMVCELPETGREGHWTLQAFVSFAVRVAFSLGSQVELLTNKRGCG